LQTLKVITFNYENLGDNKANKIMRPVLGLYR
jgi:hypothetical protein